MAKSKKESKTLKLIKEDLKKIAIGAGVAGAGAVLTYATQEVSNIDYGEWTPVITALMSILANTIRKWLILTKY